MNKLMFTLVTFFCYTSLFAQPVKKDGFQFESVYNIACSDVKSQGQTGTCWSFSTISFLESEALKAKNVTVDLSDMFPVWHTYKAKAKKYLRYHGKTNFSQGSLSHDVINVLKKHGAMPESAFEGKKDAKGNYDHNALEKDLKAYLDQMIADNKVDLDWEKKFEKILDTHMGTPKEKFTHEGTEYTPRSFADDYLGLVARNYANYTSFSHMKIGRRFVLQIPDNFSDGMFFNTKLGDLSKIVDNALKQGHTVAWDCDVSERGFSAQQGLAILPAAETLTTSKSDMNRFFEKPHGQKTVTDNMRQIEFDSYELTDDHLMQIVGLAKDQNGTEYYVVKNSWGKIGPFDGFLYASKAYFDMNTISICVNSITANEIVKGNRKTRLGTGGATPKVQLNRVNGSKFTPKKLEKGKN